MIGSEETVLGAEITETSISTTLIISIITFERAGEAVWRSQATGANAGGG